jgi:hypothetical protein
MNSNTEKINEISPSERPVINRDSIKKFYIEPDTKTDPVNC